MFLREFKYLDDALKPEIELEEEFRMKEIHLILFIFLFLKF